MEDLLDRTLGEQVELNFMLADDLWAAFTDANPIISDALKDLGYHVLLAPDVRPAIVLLQSDRAIEFNDKSLHALKNFSGSSFCTHQ